MIAAPGWLLASLLIACAAALGLLVGLLARRVLRGPVARHAARSQRTWDDAIVKGLSAALPVLGLWLAVSAALKLAEPDLPAAAVSVAWVLVGLAGAMGVAFVLMRMVGALLGSLQRRKPRYAPVTSTIRFAAAALLYGGAALVFLGTLGVEITPILASLGVGALAVALALQDTLSNLFAGLWMRASRDVRQGHFVRLADEDLEGRIVNIGWRTTRIRAQGGMAIIVPNAAMAKAIVLNFDLPTKPVPLNIEVPTTRDVDLDHVCAVLEEEARAAASTESTIQREPAAVARFLPGVTDRGYGFTLTVHVAHVTDLGVAQDALQRRIVRRLRSEGIRIPYHVQESRPFEPNRSSRPAGAGGERHDKSAKADALQHEEDARAAAAAAVSGQPPLPRG